MVLQKAVTGCVCVAGSIDLFLRIRTIELFLWHYWHRLLSVLYAQFRYFVSQQHISPLLINSLVVSPPSLIVFVNEHEKWKKSPTDDQPLLA